MPPKKKEEEIDLSTLPPCRSLSIKLAYRGKKHRGEKFLDLPRSKPFKFERAVTRKEIIDYAKEKGLWVDPATLNEKQKKDSKLMSELPLELTPDVLGKSAVAFLKSLELKFRLDKKAKLEGKEEKDDKKTAKKEAKKGAKEEPPPPVVVEVPQREFERNFDLLFVLEEYPKEGEYNEFLAHGGQLLMMANVTERIEWLGGLDEEDEYDGEQPVGQTNLVKVKQAEEYTAQDNAFNTQQRQVVDSLRHQIKKCAKGPLLNVLVDDLQFEVDPYSYNDDHLKQMHQSLLETVCEYSQDLSAFLAWLATKRTKPFKFQHRKPINSQAFRFLVGRLSFQNKTPFVLVDTIAKLVDEAKVAEQMQQAEEARKASIVAAIEGKQSAAPPQQGLEGRIYLTPDDAVTKVKYAVTAEEQQRVKAEQLALNQLVLPGCNRERMPPRAERTPGLRNYKRSLLAPFVDCEFQVFEQRISTVYFQNMLLEQPEGRKLDLGGYNFLERLGPRELRNRLYEALLSEPNIVSKYNQKEDRLYLILHQRTPRGRVLRKGWQNSWAVLPNFQNWVALFKNNEDNLRNEQFYDLDCRRYGGQIEKVKVVTPADRDTLLHVQKTKAAGEEVSLVRVSKGGVQFGLNSFGFWLQKEELKFFTQKDEWGWSLVINSELGNTIIVNQKCEVYQKHNGRSQLPSSKTLLSGHTLLYSQPRHVLHPSGEHTVGSPLEVINCKGLGVRLPSGQLTQTPTVTRRLEGLVISKREDQTTVVSEAAKPRLWVQFPGGTKYFREQDHLVIERAEFARLELETGRSVSIELGNCLRVRVEKHEDGAHISIRLKDSTVIEMEGAKVQVKPQEESVYHVDLEAATISFIDKEKNCYVVDKAGKCEVKLVGAIHPGGEEDRPATPPFQPGEYLEEQTSSLPLPELYVQPRLFIVEGDGTGTQLKPKSEAKGKQSSLQKSSFKKNAMDSVNFSRQSLEEQRSKPSIVVPGIPGLDIIPSAQGGEASHQPEMVEIRRETMVKSFSDPVERQQFRTSLNNYFAWKKQFLKSYNEFGHLARTAEERQADERVLLAAMRTRTQMRMVRPVEEDWKKSVQAYEEKLLEKKKSKEAENTALKKTVTKKQHVEPVPKKAHPRQSNSAEEELSQRIDYYVGNYFQTQEGYEALRHIPPNLNPMNKRRPEEVSKIEAQQEEPKEASDQPAAEQNNSLPSKPSGVVARPIVLQPSVFTKAEIEQERYELQMEKQSYHARELRRKEYDVYQQPRREAPVVPSVQRSNPQCELNQKYILTETMTDRKIKISSMKNKLNFKAPSLQEVRQEGTHQALMKTFDRKYDYTEMVERKTIMIHADLNDRLRRDVLITPAEADFGTLKVGAIYELPIRVKNQDAIAQRIHVRPCRHPCSRAFLLTTGPIPLGITRTIVVRLRAEENAKGKYSDEFEVVTKHQIYKIPIQAIILGEEGFARSENEDRLAGGSGVVKPWVRVVSLLDKAGESSMLLPKLKNSRAEQSLQLR